VEIEDVGIEGVVAVVGEMIVGEVEDITEEGEGCHLEGTGIRRLVVTILLDETTSHLQANLLSSNNHL